MARKGGLGRGLEALIPGGQPSGSEGDILSIPLDQILPNPHQPRQDLNSDDLSELAASIREHGILQPLVVTKDAGVDAYILIAGERRLRAARLAGLNTVPVIVRLASEQQRLELALIENIQRADLAPLETAEAYHKLSEDFGLSHEEISERVGKSRVTVTNTLRLLKLPEAARNALAKGQITEGHARALLQLLSPQAQAAVLQMIIDRSLNVRQTEELVRKYSGERPLRQVPQPPKPEIRALEERLRERLGTRVVLRHGKKGGSMVIHYYSDEELNVLVAHLLENDPDN
jgi:ParB family transcriptional regulator, chromosome partitioning protein